MNINIFIILLDFFKFNFFFLLFKNNIHIKFTFLKQDIVLLDEDKTKVWQILKEELFLTDFDLLIEGTEFSNVSSKLNFFGIIIIFSETGIQEILSISFIFWNFFLFFCLLKKLFLKKSISSSIL